MITKSIIDVYSQISKANPVWTKEEELSAIKKWCNTKNMDKFVNEAMKHNLGIVFKAMEKTIVNRTNEDIFQKAVIAMVDSLRKFDPKKGVRISTWVTQPVYWAIRQAMDASNHECSITDEMNSINYKNSKSGKLRNLSVVSIDTPIGSDSDSNETIGSMLDCSSLNVDYSISSGIVSNDEVIAKNDVVTIVTELLRYSRTILNEKESCVIYGLANGNNLSQISEQMNLSRVRMSQLAKSAFCKIRNSKFAPILKKFLDY